MSRLLDCLAIEHHLTDVTSMTLSVIARVSFGSGPAGFRIRLSKNPQVPARTRRDPALQEGARGRSRHFVASCPVARRPVASRREFYAQNEPGGLMLMGCLPPSKTLT